MNWASPESNPLPDLDFVQQDQHRRYASQFDTQAAMSALRQFHRRPRQKTNCEVSQASFPEGTLDPSSERQDEGRSLLASVGLIVQYDNLAADC